MNTRAGNELSKSQQSEVLRQFVHRYTGDNHPQWAKDQTRPHFKNDQEWLKNTRFFVNKDGNLSRRYKHCISTPVNKE